MVGIFYDKQQGCHKRCSEKSGNTKKNNKSQVIIGIFEKSQEKFYKI